MEWLARNAEFLSPDAITKCLLAFKELYSGAESAKTLFITGKHTSQAAVTVVHLIEHARSLSPRDDEAMSRLAILTSILEPLLVNDQNLDRALETKAIELLVSLLIVPEAMKDEL